MTKKRIYRFSMMILHAFLLVFLSLSIIPSLNEQTNHLPIETKSYETYQSLYYPFELVWNGTITPSNSHTYVIETANDLFQFSQLANGVNKQVYLSLSYVLGNDIDYSDASRLGRFFRTVGFTPNGNPDPMKTPIQNQAENPLAFQGSFDGQGFEISNLLLESITFSEYSTTYLNSLEYFSMFSVVGSNGVIQNVGFINPIYVQAINYGVMVGASVVAGANHGNINHVYYIDNRASSEAGLNVNGNFHLSGLVVRNYGVLEDSFVATPRIKATSVSANASVSYLVHQIFGSTARLYYNSTIGLDTPNANETTRGLSTSAFQVSSNFSAKWFFNNSYLVANQLSNTYPILKGFKRLSGAHYISTAADLVYFTKIINQPFNFNTVNFQITADIDMSSVSRYAIVSTITNYTNTFQSRLISTNPTGILYVRTPGDNNFFSILNLSLLTANDQGTYAGMGLFGSVSGTIRDLNFFNVNVKLNNSSTFTSEEFIAVGSIVTRLNGGTINNVNVFSTISIDPGLVKRVYVGGLVGFGNGTITLSTSNGSINGGIHPYVSDHANSAIGGFVGYSGNLVSATLGMNINNSVNRTSITGIGFSSTPQGYQNIGGFIGTGVLVSFVNIVNEANILSHAVNSMADGLSMGGIIGYLLNTTTSNTNIVSNYGTISVVINRIQKVRIGVGFGVGANVLGTTARTYNNINNYGTLNLIKPNQEQLLESDFQAMNVLVAGIFLTHNLALTLDRATNYADFEIDLNYIQQFAGVLFVNQNFVTGTNNDFRDYFNNTSPSQTATQGLNRATNFGNIHAFTSGTLYTYLIKISGISLGKGPSLFLARNEGDISVELNHDAPYELANAPSTDNIALNQKNIIITGVAEDILSSRRASALYNSGHLKLTSDPTKNIKFHVFVSGIIHRNRNTTTTITTNIAHLLLNDGYIDVSTSIQGNVRAAGIVSINSGTIQSSINAGDVRAVNATKPRLDALNPDTDFLVDAAGIAAMNVSTSTSTILMNAVNYGDIIAHSTTAHGRAVAAGILARNNRREDQRALINGDSYFATQIRHSINYGTIYSWNERVEDFAVKSEAFAISGGILGVGLLRIDTTINYGSVYSKTLAGGIIGHLDMFNFARYTTPSSVVLANLINYGDIRKLTSSSAFGFNEVDGITLNASHVSISLTANGNQAYGGIIGNIYVGTSDWNFSTGAYAFVASRYLYWVNFDSLTDAFGTIPPTSVTNNTLANSLAATVSAIKSPDNSPYPYTNVTSYTLDSQVGGIFHESFAFKAPVSTSPAIANMIRFIPTNRVNFYLLEKIGFLFDTDDETMGIYALGPNTGIGEEGLYIPDNFSLDSLNPDGGDGSWRNVVVSGNETLNRKITAGMKQLSLSLATNIDQVQLVDNLNTPVYRILNPIIDKVNKIITFYVANNSPTAQTSGQSQASVNAYLLAGPTLTAYGAYEDAGVWKGTHVFNGSVYTESAGGTHVVVPVTQFTTPMPREFYVNTLQPSTYILGYRASFFHDPDDVSSSINIPARIQNILGPYDHVGEVRDIFGNILDTVSQHVGRVRVYSEAYEFDPLNPDADPLTYQDYEIRIVRLPNMAYTAIQSASVNGSALTIDPLQSSLLYNITSTPVHFKPSGTLGQIIVRYSTSNVPFSETPHQVVRLLDSNGVPLALSGRMSFVFTNFQTALNRNLTTNEWNPSEISYTFTITQALPAGNYTIEIQIDDSTIYRIQFNKMQSTDAFVMTMASSGGTVTTLDNNWFSDIPYGLYYNPADATNTRILNFTNIASISEVPAASANLAANRPSYLSSISISNFSTLVSVQVQLMPVKLEGYRHQYVVTYLIRSETGVENTVTHTITERSIPSTVTAAYLGVNLITSSVLLQEFQREEVPSFRYEYTTTNLYRYLGLGLSTSVDYFGGGSPQPVSDYALLTQANGFLMDFLSSAPVGFYTLSFDYQSSHTYTQVGYPLQGVTMNWLIEFEDIVFNKIGNSNSHLADVSFTSDALFAGLNTIIHPVYMDPTLYLSLLGNPQLRQIILIPTIGIEYNNGATPLSTMHMFDYYIVGQVADTNLIYYQPNMTLPPGATVERMNADATFASDLGTDFSPIEEDEFNYVWYRIFAEDYIPLDPTYGTHYTDYFIAVQDVSNNVYLTIKVYMNATTPLDQVFISYMLIDLTFDSSIFSMYSTFDGVDPLGVNFQSRNTSSGTFYVHVLLPSGYQYYIVFEDTTMPGIQFFVPETVIPRRYDLSIYIVDQSTQEPWGQRNTTSWSPPQP